VNERVYGKSESKRERYIGTASEEEEEDSCSVIKKSLWFKTVTVTVKISLRTWEGREFVCVVHVSRGRARFYTNSALFDRHESLFMSAEQLHFHKY
jgi:hypothetical protein